jgi:threonine/homoserine/homoserine lactone efflux protein
MPEAFLAGAIAGYAIAIPMGPITVLILQLGLQCGMRTALAAAAGAASADGLYATLAGLFGSLVAGAISAVIVPARLLGAALLSVIAVRGLLDSLRGGGTAEAASGQAAGRLRTYLTFLALTVTNPVTFLYFLALTVSLPVLAGATGGRLAFAVGAFGASLSWQMVLALAGSLLHGRLPSAAIAGTRVVGGLVVLAFAVIIGLEAIRP